jgi:hypothetical protein
LLQLLHLMVLRCSLWMLEILHQRKSRAYSNDRGIPGVTELERPPPSLFLFPVIIFTLSMSSYASMVVQAEFPQHLAAFPLRD